LILGCTHYPVLAATIRLVMGDGVALVDSGRSCAEAVRRGAGVHPPRARAGRVRYFVSDMPERFREIGGVFLGEGIGEVTVVDPGAA
jgi:glutamate racemase